jgi:NTE family protein
MLEALFEKGVRPDLLVGTSVGAINAAFVASRSATVRTALELERVWRRLSRIDVFPANPVTAGLGFLGLRDHSVSAASLRRLLLGHLQLERLEDAVVPLHVVAADVLSGGEMLLSAGSAVDAVLASSALPGVFPSVAWESRLLIDGAVANNTPISHVVELGADRIIVLQAIGTEPLRRAPLGAIGAGMVAMSRALTRRLADDVGRYADAAELVILPPPRLEGIPADGLRPPRRANYRGAFARAKDARPETPARAAATRRLSAVERRTHAQPVVPVDASASAVCSKAPPSRVRELTFSLRNAFRRW